MTHRTLTHRTLWPMLALAALVLAGFGWWSDPAAFRPAWLVGFLLWAGLGVGCLTVLMLGHLLGDPWLAPVRGELEAGALTLPLLALLSVPLLLGLADVYPWARPGGEAGLPETRARWLGGTAFVVRTAIYLAVWSALAWAMTRPGRHHRRLAAVGLMLVLPTVTLAGMDWVMSLDPAWLSSLYGLAFGVAQAVAALAAAILAATLRPDRDPPGRVASLTGALLALALASAWLWFVQFLVVWSADLPHEVAWYLARREGVWWWLMPGLTVPAAGLAALLLVGGRLRRLRWVLVAATLLLLVQHAAHLYWQVRPGTPDGAPSWRDALAVAAVGLFWLAAFVRTLPGRPVAAWTAP